MHHHASQNIVSFIWGIADDVLRDVYVRGKYRDVILPMTVIRRLDAVLEPSKEAVIAMKQRLDTAGIIDQRVGLSSAAGEAFYNASPFTLRYLKNRAKHQQLKADFEAYLDGFSPNVQEILDKFRFRNQIPTLIEADILGHLIGKFLDPRINLSPKPVLDDDGHERLAGLDNHAMGTIFEELIRRFNEENNEEAGEHFTPRDVVTLMADLIFRPIAERIESGTYLVYDGACGTGGMLTLAEERLAELAQQHGKDVTIHLYGQEIQPETYAIAKADLLLKDEGAEAENIRYGSTLSSDAFPSHEFHFMLSNPPYGKSWKTDLERLGGKSDFQDSRFITAHGGDPVIKKVHKPGKAMPDPLHGLYQVELNGKPRVVEYEPDTALRDSEQVPLLEVGGIEAFFRREVLPYTPDAWIDPEKTQIGYEISFTRHFFKPAEMRTLEQIKADIAALEQENEGLLEQIIGEVAS